MFFCLEDQLILGGIQYSKVVAEDGDPVFLINGTNARIWQTGHGPFELYDSKTGTCQSFTPFDDLVAALNELLQHG